MGPTREGAICDGIKALLQAKLQTYVNLVDDTIEIPDNDFGYTGDPTVVPQNAYNYISIFADFPKHIRYYSCEQKDNFIKVGLEWVFNAPLILMLGEAKRNHGEALWRCIEDNQKSVYLGPLGIFRITLELDYRYASRRQKGGARRGLQGESTPTGNCIDAIVLGLNIWQRTTTNIMANMVP